MIKFKYILVLFLVFSSFAYAEEINWKFSCKDFTDKSLKKVSVKELNNTIIIGSCFYQNNEIDDVAELKDIFPDGMTGVTFKNCNLDNVYIPVGNTLIDCVNKLIKKQNDGFHWKIDKKSNKFEKPINELFFDEQGWSKDPKDIPEKKESKIDGIKENK